MTKKYDEIGELNRPIYDDEWIRRGLDKHQAMYSMVICYDTSDPARFEQLREFFRHPSIEKYIEYNVHIYDPWNGLGRLDKSTGDIQYDISKPAKDYQDELGTKIQDFGQALNLMDTQLRHNQTVLILDGITPEIEGKNRLVSALRSWANSKEVISMESLVILIGSSLTGALDDEIKSLIAIVEVESGKDIEYENLIEYLSGTFGLQLKKEDKEILKSALKGLNLHQSEAILRECYTLKGCFDLEQIKVSKGQQLKKTGILEVEEPREGFEIVGGYNEVKDFINNKLIEVIYNPECADKYAIPLPRGILLFGPPGTGKTLFAKAFAKEVKLPFINFNTENIYSRYLGETGQKIKTAITIANQMSPAIVFIDEIDRFGKRTATTDSCGEETRRAFSQLLEWLGDKNRKAIIVGTTNRPDDLDEAFLRTGRFDYKIPILYPNTEARLQILKIHLGIPDQIQKNPAKPKPPLAINDEDFLRFLQKEIVPKTEYYTGAELEELVTRTKRIVFEREIDKRRQTKREKKLNNTEHHVWEKVTSDDFFKSLSYFCIDRKSRMEQNQEYVKLTRKFTDDRTFLKNLEGESEVQMNMSR